MSPTVCLNMIVKNEAHVIERCLESVKPYIDSWVIVDTGSSDDTPTRIENSLKGIPGQVVTRPWVDFGHNRSEALELARGRATDYLLFIDADEVLEGRKWDSLTADAYMLTAEYGGTTYARCALVKASLAWKWVGVVHEYLTATPEAKKEPLDSPRIVVSHDGARARDPKTYAKDVEVLKAALAADPENARNAFYLAQSYRDAGDLRRARSAYNHRSKMQGWPEETFIAICERARLTELLNDADPAKIYLDAYQFRPTRAEPLYQLARHHREHQRFALAYLYARFATTLTRPADILFIDESVYAWRCWDEVSVAAANLPGRHREGLDAAHRAWASAPQSERPRIEANIKWYTDHATT